MPAHFEPHHFARTVLGFSLYPWQQKVLASVGQGHKTVLRAPNGSGKSSRVIVATVLAFLHQFPNGRCILTSGSWPQLKAQIFGNLRRFAALPMFRDWEFLETCIKTPQGGYAEGKSVDEALKMEGTHRDDGIPSMICVDEGKALLDPVYDAIAKCSWDFQLVASSAGVASGHFYQLFNSERVARYWFKCTVTFEDCPHLLSPEHSAERLMDAEVKGVSSPFYRNKWLSEFATDDAQAIIGLDSIRACQQNPPPWIRADWVTAGCDFAVSLLGDWCCLVLCRGNRIEIIDYWRSGDVKVSAATFIRHFNALGLQSYQIFADASGVGVGFIADLEEARFFLNPIHNGSPAKDPDKYASIAAQWWDEFATLISKKALILPGGDWGEILIKQLSDRQKRYSLAGGKVRIALESKQDMKARGADSPDLGDSCILAAMNGYLGSPGAINPTRQKRLSSAIEDCTRVMRANSFVPP